MSVPKRPSRHDRTPRRPRRRALRWLGLALGVIAVFAIGVAFGQALDDGPEPGGSTTIVRTLTPLPQEPPPRTVTVTVTEP